MNKDTVNTLIIVDEQFERIEGHPYEYDKSVVEIFQQHGFDTIIYGHKNMLQAFREELNARPWFSINTQSGIRKIPILGAILYRTGFWKRYEREIKAILAENPERNGRYLLFFPNVYWYNILPIASVLKRVSIPAALLYRTSIYDTIRLPKFILPVTMGIIKYSIRLLRNNRNVHYFSDSEVIAGEWTDRFKIPMKVLPIPHLAPNKRSTAMRESDKIRMYLPGGMRLEKGARLLTEAFELLAVEHPEVLKRIVLVTQFPAKDAALDEYKARLSALPLENQFLQHLTTEAYNHQLSISDVILIPYQVSEGYRARTSGILAEAIASSKPFITTDGTWMSLQARNYNTGMIVQDNQPEELAAAINTMIHNYADHERKAAAACDKWIESQSKEVYYRQLTSAIE